MGDVNWVLYDLAGNGRGAKRSCVGLGGLFLEGGALVLTTCVPKTRTARKATIRTAEYCLLV